MSLRKLLWSILTDVAGRKAATFQLSVAGKRPRLRLQTEHEGASRMTALTKTVRRHCVAVSALVLIFVITTSSMATEQQVGSKEVSPVSPKLTPKLQGLLRQEMLSIDAASKEILSALVAGEDQRVTELAQQIHDSFILAQSMTAEDKKELLGAVPEGFVTRDRAFHRIAAALAKAGREGDHAEQQVEFSRMIDACYSCHTLYATDRFPDLAN
jgi:hypothetical protein